MKLKQQYIDMIYADLALQGKIAMATGRSVQSVALWVKPNMENQEKLTTLPTLKAICEYTGTASVDELVEQTTNA